MLLFLSPSKAHEDLFLVFFLSLYSTHDWRKVIYNEWCLQGRVRLLPAFIAGNGKTADMVGNNLAH